MSTFHGLEMAKRALFTQQSALYTTGHNISNANTEGYTRQRVNFETLPAYPNGARNRPQIPGQLGQGVQAGSVERIRDSFLDLQYRAENNKTGYWETMSKSLYRMESLLNEPSESGLANTMDKFWQSLQDLAVNPENSGARSVVVQRGIAVADTFNYLANNLEQMKTDTRLQIDVKIKDANSLLSQINSINNQIKEIEPHGYLANDLYDKRDVLIDELSGIINIKVHKEKTSDGSLDIADGLARIELLDDEGNSIATLVDPRASNPENSYKQFALAEGAEVNNITFKGETGSIPLSSGSLKALVDVHGYDGQDGLSYSSMLSELDNMAKVFVTEFNNIHRDGVDGDGAFGLVDGGKRNFFYDNGSVTAGNIRVAQGIIDNPNHIAVSNELNDIGKGIAGNGKNGLELAKVFDEFEFTISGKSTTIKGFYEGMIGTLGVSAQEANRMAANTSVLKSQVQEQRMSVSSVSLDEEMTNMIKFQHAYNAAARSMTAVDEMLDRIINSMGLVGR